MDQQFAQFVVNSTNWRIQPLPFNYFLHLIMNITFKKAAITLVVLVGGFYAGRTIAQIQLAKASVTCMKASESKPKVDLKNENEARTFINELVDCIDKNNGFFGRLIFNKEEEKRNATFSP